MQDIASKIALAVALSSALTGQTWIRNPGNKHLYAATARMTWKDAESQAVKWGGHLATVRSQAESDWIYRQFRTLVPGGSDGLWIGYTDEVKEGTWLWTSGETTSFTEPWRPGEPSSAPGEHFAHIWGPNSVGPGLWNDAPNSPSWSPGNKMVGIVELVRPASFSVFGKGCASTATLPTVSSTATPKLGRSFPLVVGGFLPKPQFGTLILGVSKSKWGFIPLPMSLAAIGMSNCNLLVSIDAAGPILTDASGTFTTIFRIPSVPSLLGTTVYGQAWMRDQGANTLGVAMTNGFEAVVGI